MKILYLLHFNAPMGGLHENVYSSALYMNSKKNDVYVVLKEGPLQRRLQEKGIYTIISDYENIVHTLKLIDEQNVKFDIIHAHPGRSRNTALHYSVKNNIPLIMTYHGMWMDSLNQYIDKVSAIVCVSEGIKDYIKTAVGEQYEKFYVMPNGYNDSFYNTAQLFYEKETSAPINISFISRLDQDKEFIMSIFKIGLRHLSNKDNRPIKFNIIGDGNLKNDFLKECEDILNNSIHTLKFEGWLVDDRLKEAYLNSDIVIAPGRSVIEAMACGKPVISVGSKKYIGLIKHDNWKSGVYNNFGGFGNKFDDYQKGTIENDLDILLNNTKNINLIGKFSHDIATEYYKEDSINEKLYRLYHSILLENQIKNTISS